VPSYLWQRIKVRML